jgi:hypothetical protein
MFCFWSAKCIPFYSSFSVNICYDLYKM